MLGAWKRLRDFHTWNREHIAQNLGIIVAVAAVAIALWSAKIQRDTMQLDERPYVKVTFDSLAITQGNHATRNGSTQFGWDGYKAKFLVEASGKTPAFHVVAHGFCDVEQQGLNNGSTHRLWPFLFGEKTTIDCVVSTDLPDGDLPPNIPLSLTVDYDDIFEHHHSTTFCEIAVTLQGEGVPRRDAKGTLKCPDYKHIMN